MSNYNSVTPEFIDELKTLLGEKYVKTDADTLDRYRRTRRRTSAASTCRM